MHGMNVLLQAETDLNVLLTSLHLPLLTSFVQEDEVHP